MDEGSRSDAIRELIHIALGLKPQYRITTISPDLAELQQDTRRIRQTLDEMPMVLERLVVQAASIQPIAALPNTRAATQDTPILDEAESQRRARKLRRASW